MPRTDADTFETAYADEDWGHSPEDVEPLFYNTCSYCGATFQSDAYSEDCGGCGLKGEDLELYMRHPR